MFAEEVSAKVARLRAAIERQEELPGNDLPELIGLTSDGDPQAARIGLAAIFPGLIEWVNDSFSLAGANYYNEIFSQVIEFYLNHPAGSNLRQRLLDFGLTDRESIITRLNRIGNKAGPCSLGTGRLRRAIFLSRVTVGADVAVTSVLIDGLRRAVPNPSQVEIVLIGSRKLVELYGGDPCIRIRETSYDRAGKMIDRLTSWFGVVDAVSDEVSGLGEGEFVVIDPDSRLTQLGMLPVLPPTVESQHYFFFPSRVFRSPGCTSLGQIAATWIGEEESRSFLALPKPHLETGLRIAAWLHVLGARRITTISLGVGGNTEKSAGAEFETSLLHRMSRKGWVVLDRGIGAGERQQVERAVGPLKSAGIPVLEASEEDDLSGKRFSLPQQVKNGVLMWQGGIGSLAGIISQSNRYIGYDSSGQHLAAALGVPAVTIFISGNPPVFADRWAPFNRRSRVIRMMR